MDEITVANQAFPVKIIESHYELGILTLRSERNILISVRCPFDLLLKGFVAAFPEADVSQLPELAGINILSISTRKMHQYPDLLIQLDDDIEIHARPTNAGEEMWFVDVPGVAFLSP